MRVIKADLQMLARRILLIGFVGENERTQVRIDAGAVFAEYPDSFPALVIKPPVGNTYPVVVSIEGNDVVWEVLNTDLTFDGEGELQLMFVVDDVVVKTVIGTFKVNRSIIVPGTTPTPVESWVQQATLKLGEVDQAINSLEQSDATVEGLPAGSAPTVDLVDFEGHKRFEFGIPKGDKGDTYELTQEDREEIAEIAEENFTTEVKGYRDDAIAAKNRSEEILTAVSVSTEQAASSAAEAGRQAQAAALSAQAASSSATAADGSARTASEKASEANASAQNASGSASTATQKAVAAAQSATDADQSAQAAASARDTAQSTVAGAIAGIQAEGQTQIGAVQAEGQTQVGNVNSAGTTQVGAVQAKGTEVLNSIPEDYTELTEQVAENTEALKTKAEIDGYYSDMTVGNAEQLVATVGVEDSVPYNFRAAGGTADIGDRLTDKVVGGTVAWNQLQKNTKNSSANGVTYTYSEGKVTVATDSGGATGNALWLNANDYKWQWIKNHIYLISLGNSNYSYAGSTNPHWYIAISPTLNLNKNNSVIKITADTIETYLQFQVYTGNEINMTFTPQVFDLTQMFGSTIADYIYALETANAGAGVAWFRKLFPKPYYEYNAGELMSVKAASHITRGFNAWDEEWELGYYDIDGSKKSSNTSICCKNLIPVIQNTTYCFTMPNNTTVRFRFFDADGHFVSNINANTSTASGYTFTIPNGCHYMAFHVSGTTYNHDICINLSWDGERDGEYAPYEEHVYPLDSDLELRGIPKLDASNNLYSDGDTYESDGTVTRKYGIVDLGTLTWSYNSGQLSMVSSNLSSVIGDGTRIKCSTYSTETNLQGGNWSRLDKVIGVNKANCTTTGNFAIGVLVVKDAAYSDSATFKTAMSGVMLVYELATPTTETADTFQNPQIVEDFGTEEYTDAGVLAEERDVAIPVGHDTMYAANLRAKLEMSPDSPDGDGDYIVRQTNGQNEYVPLVIPAELPANPSEDGTYRLKATVSNGVTTLSWEAVT